MVISLRATLSAGKYENNDLRSVWINSGAHSTHKTFLNERKQIQQLSFQLCIASVWQLEAAKFLLLIDETQQNNFVVESYMFFAYTERLH